MQIADQVADQQISASDGEKVKPDRCEKPGSCISLRPFV